jgi:hypothetical protein
MRLAGLLIGPVVLALLIVMGAARLSAALSEPVSEPPLHASGLVWNGRVFTTRAAFAKWLDERGLSIRAWERRHPASPWSTAQPAQAAPSAERREVPVRSDQEPTWLVLVLGAAVALIAGITGAAAVHRRRVARPLRPASMNGARRVKVTALRPSLAVAAGAVQRGVVEAARPRVHTASVAAHRGIEVARPRLEGAGSAARHGLGATVSWTADLNRRLRYEIVTGRFRVAMFYVMAALFSAAIGLAVAIAA